MGYGFVKFAEEDLEAPTKAIAALNGTNNFLVFLLQSLCLFAVVVGVPMLSMEG